MRVLSMFDGISCGRVALDRIGITPEVYFASEIDEYAERVSADNWPDIVRLGDAKSVDEWDLGRIDLLLGGSPCTHWSIARKKGRETVSSGIGWELFLLYVKALRKFKPRYFLYENVKSMSPAIKEEITRALGVDPILINSDLVSAQYRERLYWTNIPNISQPTDRRIMLRDILEKDRCDWRPVGKWTDQPFFGNQNLKKVEVLKTVESDKSFTLTTKKGHPNNYICNRERTQYSNLTPVEYEVLQTLPSGYTKNVPETERYKLGLALQPLKTQAVTKMGW